MVSPTCQTRIRRHKKRIKQGQNRKIQNRNKGTTRPQIELFGDSQKDNR